MYAYDKVLANVTFILNSPTQGYIKIMLMFFINVDHESKLFSMK